MIRITSIALLAALTVAAAHAEGKRSVPTSFEGVKLGLELPADSPDSWDIDVKASASGFLGSGLQLWFKPGKENPELEYRELDLKEGDEVRTTSHRLYLVPILPKGIEAHPDPLSQRYAGFRVHLIEWSDDRGEKSDHYWWARGMCTALSSSLAAKPVIIDDMADNFFNCEFKQGNRSLEAASFAGRRISLRYDRRYTEAELAKIQKIVNKARGDRVLSNPTK